jgi:hypothetical protein
MSKITELKKQFPELNISILDLFSRIDGTKTNKYVPLLCKILGYRMQPDKMWSKEDAQQEMKYVKERVSRTGINYEGMSNNEIYAIHMLSDFFNSEDIRDIVSFRDYNERGLIVNNDITTYKTIEEIRAVVSLATLKADEKEMRNQTVKEYEDDTWLALRPLTFGASSRYGSATKWCTTYQNDKQYFERYWRRGALIYFINKITGYKFATFKALDDTELSFWNAADTRIDFLQIEIDDYMYPIIKNILKTDKSNSDLCSNEIKRKVRLECNEHHLLKSSHGHEMDVAEEVNTPIRLERRQPTPITEEVLSEINNIVENEFTNLGDMETNNPLRDRIQRLRESLGIPLESRVEVMEQPQYEIREEGVVQFNPNR